MVKVLETINLSYGKFNNLNVSFGSSRFYLIVGSNNSGKTILFKLFSSLIPTKNMITCNNVYLNDFNILDYIINIGIVERVNNKSFLYQDVYDEMRYPLYNLGYSKKRIDTRINEILDLFDASKLLNKKINSLSYQEKQKLLIMISLLHQPKVLLIDNVLEVFSNKERENILAVLKKLMEEGLTVIDFSVSLKDMNYSDKILLIDNFKIIGEYFPKDVFLNDKVFSDYDIEIPFLTDLAVKLRMYDVIDKEYLSMKAMVDDIWP